jgi:hypothetical protein
VTVGAAFHVRVWVPDVWDVVELPVTPDQPLSGIKQAALRQAFAGDAPAGAYEVKYRGAPVDETRTVRDLDLPDGAPLIVLAARRRPVR